MKPSILKLREPLPGRPSAAVGHRDAIARWSRSGDQAVPEVPGATMRIVTLIVLTALINCIFLTGCASVRGPARLARLQETPAVEPASQSWDAVVAIPLDSPLEVDLDSGDRMRGRFRVADEQTLALEYDGGIRSVPRTKIQRVVINRGRHAGNGAFWGLGIGAASGLIVGTALRCCGDPVVLPVTLILSGVGSGIGALVGVFYRDRIAIYEAPVPGTTN